MHSERLAEQPIIIRNLSPRGIGARAHGLPPLEGEEVFLKLDGRELVGRVRWVRGDRFGVHLRDPIDGAVRMPASPWAPAKNPSAGFHVFERFKPVAKPWRPGVKVFANLPIERKR